MESDLNNPSTPLPDSQQNASQPQQSASQPRQNASQPRQNASPQQNASQPQQSASQPAAQSNASDDSQTPQQKVLKQVVNWQNLHFYQKSDVLYQLTCAFCRRFLPLCGDRTVDQMVQAARSCKQNIVEGYSDAEGSSETEHKLTVVAKGSLEELKEDYRDYLRSHNLEIWGPRHEKYITCQSYFRKHNDTAWYMRQIRGRSDEDICNMALIVIFQALALLRGLIDYQDRKFLEEGGIREQRYRARTESRGYGYKNGKFYGPGTRRKDE